MSLWKIAYTCQDLGVCQGRTPNCSTCMAAQPKHELPTPTYPFAPGVIDGYRKPANPALTTWLVRWVYLTPAVSVVCFLAGWLP